MRWWPKIEEEGLSPQLVLALNQHLLVKQQKLEFLSLEFSLQQLKFKKHHRHPCPTLQRGE